MSLKSCSEGRQREEAAVRSQAGTEYSAVLACRLPWVILQSMGAQRDHRGWQTLKRVLETHAFTTFLLPATGGKLRRGRRVGEPEEDRKAIHAALRIDWRHLPQTRVRIAGHNAPTL